MSCALSEPDGLRFCAKCSKLGWFTLQHISCCASSLVHMCMYAESVYVGPFVLCVLTTDTVRVVLHSQVCSCACACVCVHM